VNVTPISMYSRTINFEPAVDAIDRLKLDYTGWIPAHPPNPDKPLTKADVMSAVKAGTN
jgi:hypothetical protein